ncbi:hypothetical protein ACH5RR_009140 [Cinchona calisaya]|uniref:Uncharacterized protein n=1 Tax=Cinchona calisaya TaxID=153742 RepID=A0ABD3AI65_9GENT
MAVLQFSSRGQPSLPIHSFVVVIADNHSIPLREPSSNKGDLVVFFFEEQVVELAKPFRYALTDAGAVDSRVLIQGFGMHVLKRTPYFRVDAECPFALI